MANPKVVLIEPFFGGSHKQLIDLLVSQLLSPRLPSTDFAVLTLPAKKWKWRASASSLHFSQALPPCAPGSVLFCSSMLNLSELVALRPDLLPCKKLLYFHENQLNYPARFEQDRDFQLSWMQVLSALAADEVLFNSKFNCDSFLGRIDHMMRRIPDSGQRVLGLGAKLAPKCRVLYFPVPSPPPPTQSASTSITSPTIAADAAPVATAAALASAPLPSSSESTTGASAAPVQDATCAASTVAATSCCGPASSSGEVPTLTAQPSDTVPVDEEESALKRCKIDGDSATPATAVAPAPPRRHPRLRIAWNHRWEYDKNPGEFFEVLKALHDKRVDFEVVVLGEVFDEIPPEFTAAREWLEPAGKIAHWGYAESKAQYFELLRSCDVAISTAVHEFFGVAMVEAALCGCYPLCPNRLAYPEIFPAEHLYGSPAKLKKTLKDMAFNPSKVRAWRQNPDKIKALGLDRFSWEALRPQYEALLHLSSE